MISVQPVFARSLLFFSVLKTETGVFAYSEWVQAVRGRLFLRTKDVAAECFGSVGDDHVFGQRSCKTEMHNGTSSAFSISTKANPLHKSNRKSVQKST